MRSPAPLVSSYLTVSPLPPRHPRGPDEAAVSFLWHWSVGFPPLGVTQHPALRSPDFPPAASPRPATVQPSLAPSQYSRRDGSADDRGAGDGVHAIVQGVVGVAGDLVPDHLVAARLGEDPLPEIAIGHGLLLTVAPAVLLPALPPALEKAVDDVSAVRMDVNPPAPGNRRQPFGDSLELHALIGGVGGAAGDHALLVAVHDDRGPAAGPGIARARAVGVDGDVDLRASRFGDGGSRRQAGSCQ